MGHQSADSGAGGPSFGSARCLVMAPVAGHEQVLCPWLLTPKLQCVELSAFWRRGYRVVLVDLRRHWSSSGDWLTCGISGLSGFEPDTGCNQRSQLADQPCWRVWMFLRCRNCNSLAASHVQESVVFASVCNRQGAMHSNARELNLGFIGPRISTRESRWPTSTSTPKRLHPATRARSADSWRPRLAFPPSSASNSRRHRSVGSRRSY